MNNTIRLIQNHSSVRKFAEEPLTTESKQELLNSARSGSSSHFIQATSIVEVTDSKIRNEIAELSGSESYVKTSGAFFVFIADLYRQATILTKANQSLVAVENIEALISGIVDTAIAGENMALTAESLDLGICFIGGIRNDLKRISELLNLPKFTVPVFGLTVGVPIQQNEVKPRLPQRNTVFTNQYRMDEATDLKEYDRIMTDYYADRQTNQQNTDWTQKMQTFFAELRRKDVAAFVKSQGFIL